MNESILNTIKKMLGLDAGYTAFDTDVIVLINAALMTLHQYGATPKAGLAIIGASETWSQLLPSDKLLEAAKAYIFLKVKMGFDPPSSSYVLNAYKEQASEWEWRIKEQLEAYPGNVKDDPIATEVSEGDTYDDDHQYYNPWEDDEDYQYQDPSEDGGDP